MASNTTYMFGVVIYLVTLFPSSRMSNRLLRLNLLHLQLSLCTRQLLPAVEAQNLQVFLDSSLSSPRSSYQQLPESLFISTPYFRTPPRLTTSHVSILIQDTICLHRDSCNGHLTRLSASGLAHLETLLNTAARAILFKKKKKKKVQSWHSSVQNLPKMLCFYSVKPKFPTQSPVSLLPLGALSSLLLWAFTPVVSSAFNTSCPNNFVSPSLTSFHFCSSITFSTNPSLTTPHLKLHPNTSPPDPFPYFLVSVALLTFQHSILYLQLDCKLCESR